MISTGIIMCCAWTSLFLEVIDQGDRKAIQKGIDPITIAAYEKLGGVYGGMVPVTPAGDYTQFGIMSTGTSFQEGRAAAEKGLPGFSFEKAPKCKLPKVATPFCLRFGPYLSVSDVDLKDLAGLDQLTELFLCGPTVTDLGLKNLAVLNKLSSLTLWGTKVTDQGLKDLLHFKNLSTVNLYRSEVSDLGLRELAKIERLSVLNLCYSKVTDLGLKELAPLKNLTWLGLGMSRVTDKGIKELTKHKKLSVLFLNGTSVTDEGLKDLAEIRSLSTIGLDDTKGTCLPSAQLTLAERVSQFPVFRRSLANKG